MQILSKTVRSEFLIYAATMAKKWHLIVVLMCISLISNKFKHLLCVYVPLC